jgi:hypothetical protein
LGESLHFELSFSDEDAKQVIALLDQAGATNTKEVQQKAVSGIEVLILAVIAVEALVNIIIKLLQVWKCGVVVDARGSRVVTKKNCDLPHGDVLVLTKDGARHELHRPSEFDLGALIKQNIGKHS